MPRYLFHIVDGEGRRNSVRDGEGVVLRDATEARREAIGLASDIARHDLDGSTPWKIIVTDEQGDTILTVPLAQGRSLRARAWSALHEMASNVVQGWTHSLASIVLAGVIVAQAVLLAALFQDKGSFEMASAASKGAVVSVRFARTATIAEVTSFLDTHKGTIIDGPRVGGFFRIRLSLPHEELAPIVRRMAQETTVEFVAAVE